MSDPWFRHPGEPRWHLGFRFARCGVRADERIAVTDLRPKTERPLVEWCGDCYVDREDRRLAEIKAEMDDLETEAAQLRSEGDARQTAWQEANGS